MILQTNDPPVLAVGTEVSAKYRGAFCEAKVRKVVRSLKALVSFKSGESTQYVAEECIKGKVELGSEVSVKLPDRRDWIDGTISRLKDCSQYTVVFNDGDVNHLRRSALCLKSGRHFAKEETLDQLPLNNPEHFGLSVTPGTQSRKRGGRAKTKVESCSSSSSSESEEEVEDDDEGSQDQDDDEESDDDDDEEEAEEEAKQPQPVKRPPGRPPSSVDGPSSSVASTSGLAGPSTSGLSGVGMKKMPEVGEVICMLMPDKSKKHKDAWMPCLVVAPTAQDALKIKTNVECLVRSFQDGRYYTVGKKEMTPFTRQDGERANTNTLRAAVEKAFNYVDKDELPPHWDRDVLFGRDMVSDRDSSDADDDDDESRDKKDHFVAQLYKFMDDRGTPIFKTPTVCSVDLDLYRAFKIVKNLGGSTKVTNQQQWKTVFEQLGLPSSAGTSGHNQLRLAFKKHLAGYEEIHKKLGCTLSPPRNGRTTANTTGRGFVRVTEKSYVFQNKPEEKPEPEKQGGRGRKRKDGSEAPEGEGSSDTRATPTDDGSSWTSNDEAGPSTASGSGKKPVAAQEPKAEEPPPNQPKKRGRKKGSTKKKLAEAAVKVENKPEVKIENLEPESSAGGSKAGRPSLADPLDDSEEDDNDRVDSDPDWDYRAPSSIKKTSRRMSGSSGEGKSSMGSKIGSAVPTDDEDDDEPVSRTPFTEANSDIKVGHHVQVVFLAGSSPGNKKTGSFDSQLYHAKVLNLGVNSKSGQREYYVHYTGWNPRWDEWVSRGQIMSNLTVPFPDQPSTPSVAFGGIRGRKRGRGGAASASSRPSIPSASAAAPEIKSEPGVRGRRGRGMARRLLPFQDRLLHSRGKKTSESEKDAESYAASDRSRSGTPSSFITNSSNGSSLLPRTRSPSVSPSPSMSAGSSVSEQAADASRAVVPELGGRPSRYAKSFAKVGQVKPKPKPKERRASAATPHDSNEESDAAMESDNEQEPKVKKPPTPLSKQVAERSSDRVSTRSASSPVPAKVTPKKDEKMDESVSQKQPTAAGPRSAKGSGAMPGLVAAARVNIASPDRPVMPDSFVKLRRDASLLTPPSAKTTPDSSQQKHQVPKKRKLEEDLKKGEAKASTSVEQVSPLKSLREQRLKDRTEAEKKRSGDDSSGLDVYEFQDAEEPVDMKFNAGPRRWGGKSTTSPTGLTTAAPAFPPSQPAAAPASAPSMIKETATEETKTTKMDTSDSNRSSGTMILSVSDHRHEAEQAKKVQDPKNTPMIKEIPKQAPVPSEQPKQVPGPSAPVPGPSAPVPGPSFSTPVAKSSRGVVVPASVLLSTMVSPAPATPPQAAPGSAIAMPIPSVHIRLNRYEPSKSILISSPMSKTPPPAHQVPPRVRAPIAPLLGPAPPAHETRSVPVATDPGPQVPESRTSKGNPPMEMEVDQKPEDLTDVQEKERKAKELLDRQQKEQEALNLERLEKERKVILSELREKEQKIKARLELQEKELKAKDLLESEERDQKARDIWTLEAAAATSSTAISAIPSNTSNTSGASVQEPVPKEEPALKVENEFSTFGAPSTSAASLALPLPESSGEPAAELPREPERVVKPAAPPSVVKKPKTAWAQQAVDKANVIVAKPPPTPPPVNYVQPAYLGPSTSSSSDAGAPQVAPIPMLRLDDPSKKTPKPRAGPSFRATPVPKSGDVYTPHTGRKWKSEALAKVKQSELEQIAAGLSDDGNDLDPNSGHSLVCLETIPVSPVSSPPTAAGSEEKDKGTEGEEKAEDRPRLLPQRRTRDPDVGVILPPKKVKYDMEAMKQAETSAPTTPAPTPALETPKAVAPPAPQFTTPPTIVPECMPSTSTGGPTTGGRSRGRGRKRRGGMSSGPATPGGNGRARRSSGRKSDGDGGFARANRGEEAIDLRRVLDGYEDLLDPLDPSFDEDQTDTELMRRLTTARTVYQGFKSEVASIDKRRKRFVKKREES